MRLAVVLFAALTIVGAAQGIARAQGAVSIAVPTVASAPPLVPDLSAPVWKEAAVATLGFDRQTHAAAAEQTTAYLLTDGKSLYVGFDARQTRTPLVTNQHTNNVGVDTDDEVKIALWPGGRSGFNYQFVATPIGTRYQVSSENTNYEPHWDAVGKPVPGGYIVVMRIPLKVVRGGNPRTWLVQLSRWEVTTGSLYLWSGGPTVQGTSDDVYARPLLQMPAAAGMRPQPRVAIYGLAEAAAPSIGGSTSRSGADIAIPVTSGTSLIAAIHPDFSNVENDQQTISPTAFRRYFNETRPFFTQGANFYNVYECDACPSESSLYTPAIPTPRDGYAIEGNEGPMSFASFDAVGYGRADTAQSVTVKTNPQTLRFSAQRVAVDMPGFKDDTLQFDTKWDDRKHHMIYANYGTENGTFVNDASQSKFAEIGGAIYGPFSYFGGGIRRIGAQYNPYDGFFSNTAIAGYGVSESHNWFPSAGFAKSISAGLFTDHYQSTTGQGTALVDYNVGVDLVTRKLWEFSTGSGSSYFLIGNALTPITQNQTAITYHSGTATPTTLSFATGIFGGGRLNSWNRSTSFDVGPRATLTLQAYNTSQYLPGQRNEEWLERVSLAFAQGPDASFAIGLRKIVGVPPYLGVLDTSCAGGCTNVSFAYHKRFDAYEFYTAYGDPSRLITRPQFILKLIRYVGADKGT